MLPRCGRASEEKNA